MRAACASFDPLLCASLSRVVGALCPCCAFIGLLYDTPAMIRNRHPPSEVVLIVVLSIGGARGWRTIAATLRGMCDFRFQHMPAALDQWGLQPGRHACTRGNTYTSMHSVQRTRIASKHAAAGTRALLSSLLHYHNQGVLFQCGNNGMVLSTTFAPSLPQLQSLHTAQC